MQIEKYEDYFHDGAIISVNSFQNTVVFAIQSAEISREENADSIPLSKHKRIKGKLHLDDIEYMYEDDVIKKEIRSEYDRGSILNLEIGNQEALLQVTWRNFPFREGGAFVTYRIKAGRIWWENIPDLFDPWGDTERY